jgi:ferredoxin
MSRRADPRFLSELQKHGAVNIESCFNCGNCTAVCPLSADKETFPRRMIRYAQLGMRDKLTGSKELWMCYYCGECTATCPRQADPGEFMAAARRYAITRYDRLGLAKLLYASGTLNALFLTLLAVVLGLFLYIFHGPMPRDTLRLFEFIPDEVIHSTGVIAGVIIFLIAISGMIRMMVRIGKTSCPEGARLNWLPALWQTIKEVFGQQRYRRDCEAYGRPQPWYIQKWFIHASMLWGFMGLFLATALDYLLRLLGVKPTGAWVPIWYPTRLLGTLAGAMLVYGVTVAIVKRMRKADEAAAYSTPSDWAFLILLWLAGMSGFALEAAIYLPQAYGWSYWMLLVHLVVVLELLVLLPFTKFAHVLYRTMALYVHALKPVSATEGANAGPAD